MVLDVRGGKVSESTLSELFGSHGELIARVLPTVIGEVRNAKYEIMDEASFEQLCKSNLAAAQRVYWTELLQRAHWAAASNLMRHERWLDACVREHRAPNYLAFAACLRGLVESAADASHSLGAVPLTLAHLHTNIEDALSERAKGFVMSSELENHLIHFQFARRLSKQEPVAETHRAKTMEEYLRAIDSNGEAGVKECYAELCQLTHPAAHSLLWFSVENEATIGYRRSIDAECIQQLCSSRRSAIEHVQMVSANTSLLVLAVVNRLPLNSVWTRAISKLSLETIPLWQKIEAELSAKC